MYTKEIFKSSAAGSVLTAGALIFVLVLINSVSLVAYDASDNMTLDVNISQLAAIEVLPTGIVWLQIVPGSNGTVRNVSVKNIGSYNMTDIYIDVNTEVKENSNPVGKGNISKYAAGGLMLFRNETSTIDYFPLGRLEWNLSEVMDTEVLNLGAGVKKYAHGWYRLANGNEYLWKLENGTTPNGTWCNSTSAVMKIKMNPENSTNYNRDLSLATSTGSADAANADWTFFSFGSGPLKGRCAAAYYDCTRIYLYKYDKANGFKDCTSSAYMATANLTPGERFDKLKIKASIPRGTPAGNTKQSTMTVYAYIA